MFEFRDTLAEVVIVDYSNQALTIGAIDVVNALAAGSQPVVRISSRNADSFANRSTTMQFDLKHTAAPSLVDIEKRGTGTLTLTNRDQQPDRADADRELHAVDRSPRARRRS